MVLAWSLGGCCDLWLLTCWWVGLIVVGMLEVV